MSALLDAKKTWEIFSKTSHVLDITPTFSVALEHLGLVVAWHVIKTYVDELGSALRNVCLIVKCIEERDCNKRIKVYCARQMLGSCKYPSNLFVRLERNL